MVISTLVSKEGDRILRQGDHLVGACIGHGRVVHSFVHSQACSGGVGSPVRVDNSQAVGREELVERRTEHQDQAGPILLQKQINVRTEVN